MLLESDRAALPVVERMSSREPIGIVTGLAITARLVSGERDSGNIQVRDVMEEPLTVAPDTRRDDVWRLLEKESRGYALVVDESGDCVGVVARSMLRAGPPPARDGTP